MPQRRLLSFPLLSCSVTGLLGLGLINLGNAALAQTAPPAAIQQPVAPLSGYVLEVSGSTARLSLTAEDDVRAGDEFSALQYGEEIARLRIKTVTKSESIADILLQKPGVLLRRLDTVIPSTAVVKPAQDLQAPPPTPPALRLQLNPKRKPGSRSRTRKNPEDIVSRADWVYPALSTLAHNELLPNTPSREFHGDQQLTRDEIRGLIEEAVTNREREDEIGSPLAEPSARTNSDTAGTAPPSAPPPPTPSSPNGETQGALPPTPVEETTGPAAAPPVTAPPSSPSASDSNLPVSRSDRPTDRLLYHLAREYGVESDLPEPKRGLALSKVSRYRLASGDEPNASTAGTLQGFMHLGRDSYGVVSLSRARREWYGDHDYPWLNEAYVKTKWLGVDWQIGQKALRWGPGYTGSLVLGDVTPSLPMIRGTRTWSLGRILGKLNVDQFVSRYTESGKSKYLMGRRISRSFGRKFDLGISETAKTASLPNPGILFLPFQLYQRWFEDNTNVINIQADIDASFRTGRQEFYGEFFIDDITAPKGLGAGFSVPRKVGFLGGWRYASLFGQEGTDLRLEWAQTDRNTYLHRNPSVSYFDRGLPLGHPMGPNSRSLMVRVDRQINPKLELMGALQFLSQRAATPPVSARGTALTLAAAYDFSRDRSLMLKVSPNSRVDRYNVPQRSTVELITDWVF